MRASPERDSLLDARPSLTPLVLDAPLAGVSSAIITAATRRVARRWRDEAAAGTVPAASIKQLLTACH